MKEVQMQYEITTYKNFKGVFKESHLKSTGYLKPIRVLN